MAVVCIDLMYGIQFPRARTLAGQRSLAYHGPSICNSLPSTLRDSSLFLRAFRGQLKTYLFGRGQRTPCGAAGTFCDRGQAHLFTNL